MKISRLCLSLLALASLAGCTADDLRDNEEYAAARTLRPRYINFSHTQPSYRVYYSNGQKSFYRQHYHDNDLSYATRVDSRRVYTPPAMGASLELGH